MHHLLVGSYRVFIKKYYSDALVEMSATDPAIEFVNLPRGRQGRQQNGDTYTLEIAFPAVKYVFFCFKKKKTFI